MTKKKIIFISSSAAGILVLLFAIYNLVWYFCSYNVYKSYVKDIPEVGDSGKYVYEDEEDYHYSVKLPAYLCFDGNLSVSEEEIDHALIIWIESGGKKIKAGVILTVDGEWVQIELKDSVTAEEQEYQYLIDENTEKINTLFEKANKKWNLGLE